MYIANETTFKIEIYCHHMHHHLFTSHVKVKNIVTKQSNKRNNQNSKSKRLHYNM